MDIPAQTGRLAGINMKCEMINGILTFVLGILAALGVLFALQTINRSRELNSLQITAVQINQNYMRLQGLAGEVAAYDQKNQDPALTRILQGH